MVEVAHKLPTASAYLCKRIAELQCLVLRQEQGEGDFRAQLWIRVRSLAKRNRESVLSLQRLELLWHQRFESIADNIAPNQLAFFDETALNVLVEVLDTQVAEARVPRSERTEPSQISKRKSLPVDLPWAEGILDLPEDAKPEIAATHMGIGYDETEPLYVLPEPYCTIRIKRAKYPPNYTYVAGAEAGLFIAPRRRQARQKVLAHSLLLTEGVHKAGKRTTRARGLHPHEFMNPRTPPR